MDISQLLSCRHQAINCPSCPTVQFVPIDQLVGGVVSDNSVFKRDVYLTSFRDERGIRAAAGGGCSAGDGRCDGFMYHRY